MTNEIIVSAPEIVKRGGRALYRAGVTFGDLADIIEIDVHVDFGEFLAPSSDAMLIACLIPAMYAGVDIEINGPVSPDLLTAARKPIQTVLRCNKPYLQNVLIEHFGDFYSPPKRLETSGIGFSGGIDSLFSVIDLSERPRINAPKTLHLVNINYSRYLEFAPWERNIVRVAAQELEQPLIEVNSNIDALFAPPWTSRTFSAPEVHTLWNAAIALSLQGQISEFHYSSGPIYADLTFLPNSRISFIDPELLRLLSTDTLRMHSEGSAYTRYEKVKRVRGNPLSRRIVSVCTAIPRSKSHQNCGRCKKCQRTLLILELTGGTDEFQDVFDLSNWEKDRLNCMAHVSLSQDNRDREIAAHIKAKGYRISITSLLRAAGSLALDTAKRAAIHLAKAVLSDELRRSLRARFPFLP